ncbi:hypothetical protein D3C80_669210 [compost metagenome]
MGIDNRVVGSLQPNHPTVSIHALESLSDKFAAAQGVPERLIGRGVVLLRFAEHTVMLAGHLLQTITHGLQEAIVGRQHLTLQVEFDHRCGTHQCLDQALMLA